MNFHYFDFHLNKFYKEGEIVIIKKKFIIEI